MKSQRYKGQMVGTVTNPDDTVLIRADADGDLSISLSDANGHNIFSTIFGDLVIANRIPIVASAYNNGIPLPLIRYFPTGSSRLYIAHETLNEEDQSTNVIVNSTGTTAESDAYVSTKTRLRYLPGHESYAFFTARFENIDNNSEAFIGLFDREEGYSIGFKDGVFSYRRNRVDEEVIVPHTEFNGIMDVSDVDFSMMNIFAIKFGYLGVAPIEIYMFDPENDLNTDGSVKGMGKFKLLHQEKYTGTSNLPHVFNANLPFASYVTNGLSTNDVGIGSASFEIGNVNGHCSVVDPTARQGVFSLPTAKAVSGTNVPLVAFRNPLEATMYSSINALNVTETDAFKNTISALLKTVNITTDGAQFVRVDLYKITTANITNTPTWLPINQYFNVIDYSTDITVNLTGVQKLYSFLAPKVGIAESTVTNENFLLYPGEYAIFTATSTNNSVSFLNTWEEQF